MPGPVRWLSLVRPATLPDADEGVPMTITLERLHTPQRSASTTTQPTTPPAQPTVRKTGLLALLGEAITAARAVEMTDARGSVAVATRFAARL